MMSYWIVHRLRNIFSYNVSKWGLVFNTLLSLVLQDLDPIGEEALIMHVSQVLLHVGKTATDGRGINNIIRRLMNQQVLAPYTTTETKDFSAEALYLWARRLWPVFLGLWSRECFVTAAVRWHSALNWWCGLVIDT